MGGSPTFLDPVVIPRVKGPRVLDLGCGFGKWGYLLTSNFWETLGPATGGPIVVGCDAYRPNVEMARRSGCYAEVIQCQLPPIPFPERSFDTVLMIELIEHLEREPGFKLVEEAKRVAAHRVVLSTPNYPDFRDAHETITGCNVMDGHRSYWSRRDLRRLGFRVYGAGWYSGPRLLRRFLRRIGLLSWFDTQLRPCLGGCSMHWAAVAENVIGIWDRT